MELKGKIGYFSVSEILYLFSHFRKTGKILIKRQGEIYILNGKAVHSVYKNIKGVEALYSLSMLTDGEFEFIKGEKSAEITIDKAVSELFTEIEKRTDTISEIEKELPPLNAVPVKSQSTPKQKVALRKSDWKVLIKVDGKNEIRKIIEESGLSFYDAMKTLAWLFGQNLIYDPEAHKRVLMQGIEKINAVLDALGEGPWHDELKIFFAKSELNDYYIIKDRKFGIKKEDISLSIKELKNLFADAINVLKKSASNTLGKVLALKKIQNALENLE